MTITSVLVAGGLLWLFNYSGMDAMVATLGIAAIVCCVACTSGDVCNDLIDRASSINDHNFISEFGEFQIACPCPLKRIS